MKFPFWKKPRIVVDHLAYIIWIGVLLQFQELGCDPDLTFNEVTSIKHFSRHSSKMKLNVSAFFGTIFLKVDKWLPDCTLFPEYPPGAEDRESVWSEKGPVMNNENITL